MHTLIAETWLPLNLDAVFAFFSDAGNLEALTPPWLRFHILTPRPIAMHAGALIDYRLRVRCIPIRWQSEITVWNPPIEFVDEQTRGPYKLWRHRHTFSAIDGGTLMRDHIEYRGRGSFMEPLINRLMIAPDLRKVFAYRSRKIRELLAPQSEGSHDKIEFA